ncbi:MAG: hypothetical protein ACOX7C_10575 [Brevefilum sp.]|jgi:hypothetical protein
MMTEIKQSFGFSYFTSPKFKVNVVVHDWLSQLRRLGASTLIIRADFEKAIPEDVFIIAQKNGLSPIVHFDGELPLARKLNDVAFLFNAYAKWGCSKVILGDKPNNKSAWPTSGWHYENLVDHFLDRFIPLASHAIKIGIDPVLSPLQPGGDYWDTAFIDLALNGLKRRRLDEILSNLTLASYGYTFNRPLSWGRGGPERWSASRPYHTPKGQEDQLGFNNFNWVQTTSQRIIGETLPVMILDAGNTGTIRSQTDPSLILRNIGKIYKGCFEDPIADSENDENIKFGDLVYTCSFDLETLIQAKGPDLKSDDLNRVFDLQNTTNNKGGEKGRNKFITNYLLLPKYDSGISDVIMNKVRPLIKKLHPTIGFSLQEAATAKTVMVYPDPHLFTDEALNQLRASGSVVKVLPESGIEIATLSLNL